MSLYATYRGRAAFNAETVERPEKGPMVRARIAASIAGPTALAEDRDDLTEWVNVIAFDKRQREALSALKKGDHVVVMGAVTASYYRSRNDERRYSRTLIADAVQAMPAARTASAGDGAADRGSGEALAGLADDVIGELTKQPTDGTPALED